MPVPSSPLSKKYSEINEPQTEIISKKSLQSMSIIKEVIPLKSEKETAPTKTEIAAPFSMLSIKSFGLALGQEVSPFKNMI